MNNQIMVDLCTFYNITPNNVEILRMNEKVLVKMDAGITYFLKGEKADKAYWEACCAYAHFLSERGMHVSQYEKSIDGNYIAQIEDKVFSLERELSGGPIEVITDKELMEIGSMLGMQHCFSMQLSTPFTTATSWSFFGGNQTDAIGDYDENELSFLDFKHHYQSHPLFTSIEALYKEYRQNLQKIWSRLPQGAVQGDFCFYNMVRESDGKLGFYDFNLAGNEVYLNECIAGGVYHAWHVPYDGKLNGNERFQLFIESYIKERPWNSLEETFASQLKVIIQAFRYNRIEGGIALKSKLKQDSFLQETLRILEEGHM